MIEGDVLHSTGPIGHDDIGSLSVGKESQKVLHRDFLRNIHLNLRYTRAAWAATGEASLSGICRTHVRHFAHTPYSGSHDRPEYRRRRARAFCRSIIMPFCLGEQARGHTPTDSK